MKRTETALAAAAAALMMLPTAAVAEPGKGNGGGKPPHAQGNGKAMKANGGAKAQGNGHGADSHGQGNAKARFANADGAPGNGRRVVKTVRADDFFDRNDDALIRRYYGTSIACPPGLAAKNNGCLPPGQAKKTYGVGTILPQGVALAPLPGDLLGRLPVAPDGYYYGRYNGDVYLVENATRRIIDNIVFNLLR